MASGLLCSFILRRGSYVVEKCEQLYMCHGPLGWVGALQAPGGTWDGICQEVRPFCLETDASKNLPLPILDLHIIAVRSFDAGTAACVGSHGPKAALWISSREASPVYPEATPVPVYRFDGAD